MAFLDNSGDIILDAVLTDTGRLRLAKGDGSFRITQFAFGDDEINYGLYNKNHPSGSAYYDLDILQTPVLEAFTNNTSVLKYQLMSNNRNDLLFLPVLKVNTNQNMAPLYSTLSTYLLASNTTTLNLLPTGSGVYDISNATSNNGQRFFYLDQGLDSSLTDTSVKLSDSDSTLNETQYSIELNSKLLKLADSSGQLISPTYTDDDGFSTYIVDNSLSNFVTQMAAQPVGSNDNTENTVLAGTRGTRLTFRLQASDQVRINESLFTIMGGQTTIDGDNYYYIDTNVFVRGLTTGVSTTVPLKILQSV
jgi:hypothetical protein